MKPLFFSNSSALREWFEANHSTVRELWVGYHKKATGKPGITWEESVVEALCVGWIDGIRKSIDENSYMIRFTPRKPGSVWSSVNIRHAQRLIEEGRMRPEGLKAYEARKENKSGTYSYEQRTVTLPDPYDAMLKKDKAAWRFFEAQPASYRKAISWWIASAKKEETRLKRLERLAACCVRKERLPELTSPRRTSDPAKTGS